jgi:hypothetical protein
LAFSTASTAKNRIVFKRSSSAAKAMGSPLTR